MIVADSLIVYAFVAGSVENSTENPTAALAVGLVLVPVVFLLLAFLSRHPRAPNAVLYAMMLSLMIGVPLAAFDVVAALTLGFGAGGVVALARSEDDSWVARSIAVVLVTVYIVVLLRYQVAAALFGSAVLPLVAVGSADEVMERHAERLRRLGQG
jgi:hypothetical protein